MKALAPRHPAFCTTAAGLRCRRGSRNGSSRHQSRNGPAYGGNPVDDSTTELRVNSALSKDEQIKKQARINVTAYQGKVLLTGQSPTPDLSARAKQIAMGVEGTTEVFNEVRRASRLV